MVSKGGYELPLQTIFPLSNLFRQSDLTKSFAINKLTLGSLLIQ
jgi:hypothetical protein